MHLIPGTDDDDDPRKHPPKLNLILPANSSPRCVVCSNAISLRQSLAGCRFREWESVSCAVVKTRAFPELLLLPPATATDGAEKGGFRENGNLMGFWSGGRREGYSWPPLSRWFQGSGASKT